MEQTPLTPEPQSEAPHPPTMSLGGRLLNVFATPGDVFQEVRTASVSTDTPLTPEPQSEAPHPPTMSLGGRLLNVFATPGDVFQEVRTASVSTANWLAPAGILLLVSWAAGGLIVSQDTIKHQLSEI